jgi:hypothetical protein
MLVFAKMKLKNDLRCRTGELRELFGEPARIQSTYGFELPMDFGNQLNFDLERLAQYF